MNITATVIAFLLVSTTACASNITKDDLNLNNDGKYCVVEFANESVPTQLESPCRFVENRHGEIRSHTYHSARMTVYIIMGKPDDSDLNCSFTSQWFVLGDELQVPDFVRDDRVCVNRGGDEIAYKDVFHYIPNGQELMKAMPQGNYD